MYIKDLILELQKYYDWFNQEDVKKYFGDPDLQKVFIWTENGFTEDIVVESLEDGSPYIAKKHDLHLLPQRMP